MDANIDILMVCRENTAGVFGILCDGINKYTDYRARFVETTGTYLNYKRDLYLNDGDKKEKLSELAILAKNCKVIHWNQIHWKDRATMYSDFRFSFAPYLNNKIHSCHERGTIIRTRSAQPHGYKKIFVSTPDLLLYCPEAMFLPNPVSIPYDFKSVFPKPKLVLQCPTITDTIGSYAARIRNPEFYPSYPPESTIKSTEIFIKVMERIKEKYGIDYAVVKGVDNKTAIYNKSRCSFHFGELWLGSYGMGAIEAMYLGKPSMGRLSKQCRKVYKDWSGDECPIMQVDLETMEADIIKHIQKNEREIGKNSKKWVKKTHDQRAISKIFVETLLEDK